MTDCIVILGAAGAGKDTAAEAIQARLATPASPIRNLKFAAPLKDMCAQLFGWDRVRLDTDLEYKETAAFYPDGSPCMEIAGEVQTRRQMLQALGTDIFRNQVNDSIWLQAAMQEAAASEGTGYFVATDCRFHNELEFIKNNFDNVLVIRVEREGDGGTAASAHVSERQAQEIEVDLTISAPAGDVEGLQDNVVQAVQHWIEVTAA
ncbi:MAG TPA: hypothetical protein EYF98_04315 [Planctomycetes bacterium]|nr:hypothetical protein [Planctomycetota bacterium]